MNNSYNDRLFSGRGVRSWLHFSRYLWLRKKLEYYNVKYSSIIELGCYDGKAIDYLPCPPEKYDGYDANCENGLDIFKTKWGEYPNYKAHFSDEVATFNKDNQRFDLAICMETLEHLPREEVSAYLEKLSNDCNQYVMITIPNEIGLIFFLKYLSKLLLSLLGRDAVQRYTFLEFVYQTLGITGKVEQYDHKGFNYCHLIEELKKYFEIIDIEGTQLSSFPLCLNLNIGVVCVTLAHK